MGGEWTETTFADAISIQRGHDLPEQARRPGKIPVVGSAGPNGWHDEALASGPGLVIGRSGASAGQVTYVREDYWPHNTTLYVTDFRGNNPYFMFRLLGTLGLANHAGGSAQPSLNRNHLAQLPVRLPSRPEQDSIAELLGALDDKIELNRLMAATLEASARALFKSWFVDFDPVCAKAEGDSTGLPDSLAALFPDRLTDDGVPKSWGSTNDQLATVKRNGVEPTAVDPEMPYVGLEHIDGRSLLLTRHGQASDVSSLKTRFARSDLLFGKLRPYFHKVVIAPFAGICSSDIIVFEPRKGVPISYLALAFSETSFIDMASNAAGGTRMPRADWGYMGRQRAVRPSDKVLAAFDAAIGPSLERAQAAQAESRTIADLRDTLLPKLISGALRIRDADRVVAAA